MNLAYLAVGIVLLAGGIVDIIWTTLWVDGGSGPVSSRLTTGLWRGLRIVTREHNKALSLAGPLALVFTLVMWIGLIWVGWTFVFASQPLAVVDTRTGGPADWWGRFYYVAYTMFTDGNGDYTPLYGGSVWEVASALTTATGMAFVTLGVSYVLTVLGAVSNKRSFASSVMGLGHRSEALVKGGWTGDDFQGLELMLESLASELSMLAEQHKSYPILHYYHSEKPNRASSVAVPVFDEALAIFQYGVRDDSSVDPAIIKTGRSSAQTYVETLDTAFIEPSEEAPPAPDLDRIRDAGIPTVSDDAFADDLQELTEHRKHLLGVAEADAWEWPPVDE